VRYCHTGNSLVRTYVVSFNPHKSLYITFFLKNDEKSHKIAYLKYIIVPILFFNKKTDMDDILQIRYEFLF